VRLVRSLEKPLQPISTDLHPLLLPAFCTDGEGLTTPRYRVQRTRLLHVCLRENAGRDLVRAA
jgi:hypothetical protein